MTMTQQAQLHSEVLHEEYENFCDEVCRKFETKATWKSFMARDHPSAEPATVDRLWEGYAAGIEPPFEVRAFAAS